MIFPQNHKDTIIVKKGTNVSTHQMEYGTP